MNNLKVIGFLILAGILMGASYIFGSMRQEIKMLRETVSNNVIPANPGNEDVNAIPVITYEDVAPIDDEDHIYGNKDAKLALVEYSDFECPYCKTFHPTAKQIVDESNGEIKWIYRHLPLRGIHPNALISAVGSECVSNMLGEDAFWTYSTALMGAESLNKQVIIDEAIALGADETEFTSCLEDTSIVSSIEAGEAEAQTTGIRGTPGNILINLDKGTAQILPGAIPLANLKEAFESMK